ncbi:MAG: ATP-binding cassette domain-containing protein [Armatimonadetes bacterium]|nr:ATP-binding cassette domain-containing protein [Armatimonadota bacterium]MDW8122100.1 ATP-binding cassette domain-containing protein [Armatimonadota bacterium]
MLRVENLSISLGDFYLKDINLEVEGGEYFILLGPTGAGKTVLIECLAGLHRPQKGKIWIKGADGWVDVTHWTPEKRGIGYVPQDYALFPNMTVQENIAFGLRTRKWSNDRVNDRVRELADWLGIRHLLHRHPLTLSGGERQRVALARALAVSPPLLLLDEPLAAVDEQTRERLAMDLKRIQRESRATFLHISHNFEETRALADRVAVMEFREQGQRRIGQIVQVGTVVEVFEKPATRFVAQFTGAANVWSCNLETVSGRNVLLRVGNLRLMAEAVHQDFFDEPMAVVIRPERVKVLTNAAPPSLPNSFLGAVWDIADRGSLWQVTIRTSDDLFVKVHLPKGNGIFLETERRDVWVHLPPEHLHLCRSDSGTFEEGSGVSIQR